VNATRQGGHRVERTVAFVDLTGFTALTDAHGDNSALSVLDRFERLTRQALMPGDRLIKGIGDAFMLSFPDPNAAIHAIGRLHRGWVSETNVPLLRGGLHHGSVIVRRDDLFGATVNLAARIAAQARGGQLLATAPIAEIARARGLSVISIGSYTLHNITNPVTLSDIVFDEGDRAAPVDPICRMRVSNNRAAARIEIDGHSYRFCSLKCAATFVANRRHAENLTRAWQPQRPVARPPPDTPRKGAPGC
jgi:adenylate cyclase